MSIEKYFTTNYDLYRKNTIEENGVVKKETPTLITSSKGALGENPSNFQYVNDKDSFIFSHVLQTYIDVDIKVDDFVLIDGLNYDVISVREPLRKKNHKECRINRRV